MQDMRKPTEVNDDVWITADSPDKRPYSENVGKWMLFLPVEEINNDWSLIRDATIAGNLGRSAKVATAMKNPNAQRDNIKLVCVYTNDATNTEDVLLVLARLRRLGFNDRLNYKTDTATLEKKYAFNTSGPVSLYTTPPGTLILKRPRVKEIIAEWPSEQKVCEGNEYCTNMVVVPIPQTKEDLSDPLYVGEVLCRQCGIRSEMGKD